MNNPQSAPDPIAIHNQLVAQFNEQELQTLCFQLEVDYESLPAVGKEGKARELVTYMQRRSRLPALAAAIVQARANTQTPPPPSPSPSDRWQLSRDDFDRLVSLLTGLPEWRTPDRRIDFLDDVFAGSPRQADLLGQIDVSGAPRGAAGRLITKLVSFGQDKEGQETLGLLANRMLTYVGGGSAADFLRGLFHRYPLTGKPVATRGIGDGWRGRDTNDAVQEKVIGENTLRHIRMLELALTASRAVVRIDTEADYGTGFLVAPDLIMTNHHVIDSEYNARPCAYQFNYQLDSQMQPTPMRAARTNPDGPFYTHADLDFTVVGVLDVPEGVTPLTLTRKRLRRDERVNIIQHPGGQYKKISMQNNFVAFANARDIQYLTSTESGSSGAPVFNNDFLVVGIHHSGGNLLDPESNRRYLRNAGSSMMAVLDDLQRHAPQIYERLQIYHQLPG